MLAHVGPMEAFGTKMRKIFPSEAWKDGSVRGPEFKIQNTCKKGKLLCCIPTIQGQGSGGPPELESSRSVIHLLSRNMGGATEEDYPMPTSGSHMCSYTCAHT